MLDRFLIITGNVNAMLGLSEATIECLDWHRQVTPGIAADWEKSRHAGITPAKALMKNELERRISSEKTPEKLANYAVGCAECHTLNPDKLKDNFEHNGYRVILW